MAKKQQIELPEQINKQFVGDGEQETNNKYIDFCVWFHNNFEPKRMLNVETEQQSKCSLFLYFEMINHLTIVNTSSSENTQNNTDKMSQIIKQYLLSWFSNYQIMGTRSQSTYSVGRVKNVHSWATFTSFPGPHWFEQPEAVVSSLDFQKFKCSLNNFLLLFAALTFIQEIMAYVINMEMICTK